MKNNFITGVIVTAVIIGAGVLLSKTNLYNCTLKGNVIGIQSWECKNIISGHKISGVGAEERKDR